ncbi:MAG: hypothetical protein MJD61_01000 [Proteobacteria bacterium]|nr:hypothetical protein [Pseudomonadota bacterium]
MSVIPDDPDDRSKVGTGWIRPATSAGRQRRRALFSAAAASFGLLPLLLPTHSSAGIPPNLSIDDIIAQSGAVVVATVTEIDSRDGLRQTPPTPLTRIQFRTRNVLLGAGVQGEFDLRIRGGVHADGGFGRFSIVRELTVGDTYLLFIRPDYGITPLVAARHSCLRLVDFEGAPLVERAGLNAETFVGSVQQYARTFFGMVGQVERIRLEGARRGQQHVKGIRAASHLYARNAA